MRTAFAPSLPIVPPSSRARLCTSHRPAPAMAAPSIRVGDAGALAAAHVKRIAPAGASVAVSGGSLPRLIGDGLRALGASELPSSWSHVLLADERVVPLDHQDSNYRTVAKFLECDVVAIDPALPGEKCARDYEAKIINRLGENPAIDLVLLGLGPDGHTCSLFPAHPLLDVTDTFVAHITDSPKPPPTRVTLTLSALEAAKHVVFVVTGASKADVIQDIIENPDSKLPGAMVKPTSGNITWFLDEAAASKLKIKAA